MLSARRPLPGSSGVCPWPYVSKYILKYICHPRADRADRQVSPPSRRRTSKDHELLIWGPPIETAIRGGRTERDNLRSRAGSGGVRSSEISRIPGTDWGRCAATCNRFAFDGRTLYGIDYLRLLRASRSRN